MAKMFLWIATQAGTDPGGVDTHRVASHPP